MSAAVANEFVTTIADLQTRLKDAEDALELERSTPKRRSRRSSSSRTLRSARAANARVERDAAGGTDGHENGTAEDVDASDALEASLQTVEDDLALSRRMLEDFDGRSSDQEDDVARELMELRLALERAQRDKDDALARARSAPHEVCFCPLHTPATRVSATHQRWKHPFLRYVRPRMCSTTAGGNAPALRGQDPKAQLATGRRAAPPA